MLASEREDENIREEEKWPSRERKWALARRGGEKERGLGREKKERRI